MPESPVTPELPIPSVTGMVAAQSSFGLTKRTEGTISLLRTVVQESSATFWYEKGKAHAGQQEWQEAVHAFRKCTERDAAHWQGWIQLAAGFAKLGQVEGAAQALQQAFLARYDRLHKFDTELSKDEWESLRIELDRIKYKTHNKLILLYGLTIVLYVTKAKDTLRRKVEIIKILEMMQSHFEEKKEDMLTWYLLYGTMGEYASQRQRIATFDRIIEMDPYDPKAYFIRGYLAHGLGFNYYAEAKVYYDRAIEMNPKYDIAYCFRGAAKTGLGDYLGALYDLDRSIELNPQEAIAYSYRSDVKLCLHDVKGSISDEKQVDILEGR